MIQTQLRKAADEQANAEKAIQSLERSIASESKQINVKDAMGQVKKIADTLKRDFTFESKRYVLRLLDVQVQLLGRGAIFTRTAEVRLCAILGDDAAFTIECI